MKSINIFSDDLKIKRKGDLERAVILTSTSFDYRPCTDELVDVIIDNKLNMTLQVKDFFTLELLSVNGTNTPAIFMDSLFFPGKSANERYAEMQKIFDDLGKKVEQLPGGNYNILTGEVMEKRHI